MRTLTIDPSSATPPFGQLRSQLIDQITSGDLPQGTKLPAVRRLAADLGVSPNTVARAYRELESAGYLVTKGRGGTLVAAPPQPDSLSDAYISTMRSLGITEDSILRYTHEALVRSRPENSQ